MTQFIDVFSFVSVILRALTLLFEALTLGGVIFVLALSRNLAEIGERKLNRLLVWSSVGLAVAQTADVFVNSAVLVASSDQTWADLTGAGYFLAGSFMVAGAIAISTCRTARAGRIIYPLGSAVILCGSVMTTHSAGRLSDRVPAMILTLLHQVGAAAWIGGMPYLLIALKYSKQNAVAVEITNRFSRLAIASVALLVIAGAGMSFLYIGSVRAAYGTTYGLMVLAKIALTGAVLAMGALNFRIVRAVRSGAPPELLPLRRFAEVEAGIGFTIILAAAALTSAPPAIDVQADRVGAREIVQRTTPQWPRLDTPSWNELSPPTPLASGDSSRPQTFVPGGGVYQPPKPGDIAWSEYNHHWAGLIVLAIGILSLTVRRFAWARNWPLIFIALAVFILVRADPENWPLGPRSFWASFQVAEVAQHRVFVVLIIAFAMFEWAVQTRRLSERRAGLVFPLICAAGGALLLTHSHSVNNVKEEFLAELSHLPLAILAVGAGWSRWLEIRLPRDRRTMFAWLWPACFILIGCILLNYREA